MMRWNVHHLPLRGVAAGRGVGEEKVQEVQGFQRLGFGSGARKSGFDDEEERDEGSALGDGGGWEFND